MREVNRKAGRAAANVDWKGVAEKARKEPEKALEKEVEGATGDIEKKLKGLFGK